MVRAGMLVYFHNHSEAGPPLVMVPEHNVHNRWHFHGAGVTVQSEVWAESLVRLPDQGFYLLAGELPFDGGSWPRGTLVQLGYSRAAEPILFIAQLRTSSEENTLFFSARGVKIPAEKLTLLGRVIVAEPPGGHEAGDSG